MKVDETIETPEGTVQFIGELNKEELALVISAGINYLMGRGAIPFKVLEESEIARLHQGSDEKQ